MSPSGRIFEIQRFSEIFGALSSPKRLQIFTRLVSCCEPGTACRVSGEVPTCVGELGADLEIAPSTLSHHLKELRRVGLIRMERRGQSVECSIDPDTLEDLTQFMEFESVG